MKKINSIIIFILLLFTFFNIELSGNDCKELASPNSIISSLSKKIVILKLKFSIIKKCMQKRK